MTAVVIAGKVVLPLEGLIDMDKEIARLEKELDKLQKELDRVDKNYLMKILLIKRLKKLSTKKRKQQRYQEKYDGVKTELNN